MLLLQNNVHIQEPTVKAMMVTANRQWRTALEAILAEGVERGEFRSDLDIHLHARVLLALCNSTRDWWRPTGGASLKDVGDLYAEMAVAAVANVSRTSKRSRPSLNGPKRSLTRRHRRLRALAL
jgi:hypothetical protein